MIDNRTFFIFFRCQDRLENIGEHLIHVEVFNQNRSYFH